MKPRVFDFLMVGGGIFGLTAAIELSKRNYRVGLINPDTIPHHLAASTDLSKAVRMEYGSDTEYFRMAEICIDRWKEWNDYFNTNFYHEVGFLMLCKTPMDNGLQSYEKSSIENLVHAGFKPDRLGASDLGQRFPAFNPEVYPDASFNPNGGYVESGRVVQTLAKYATTIGVEIFQGQTAEKLLISDGTIKGVSTKEGQAYYCGHAHITAGAFTTMLLPELKGSIKATGHPVFWLKPEDPTLFTIPKFAVFTADISNSGWYGFPFTPSHGIVKVAKHSNGQELNVVKDDRQVTNDEVLEMRNFLRESLPALANAPLVYTRKCLYTDTLDGHFWIDNHPEIKGLSVGTGGSGHGFKMAPLLGEMQADIAEGGSNPFSDRYRWRQLDSKATKKEDARYME